MFPLLGAAGGALSLLNTLLQSTSAATKTGGNSLTSLEQTLSGDNGQPSQAVVGSGQGAPSLSNGTLAALIALQGQNGANGQGGLFSKLDADGDGKISKSEFESTLSKAGVDTSSADALFNKLDADGDDSISQSELAKARGGHHHHHAGGKGGLSSLLNSTDLTGASTKTSANSDGSSTTTITYADGSTVSMTTPAASSTSGGTSGGTSQSNLLEQLIKLQSQLTTQSSATASTTA